MSICPKGVEAHELVKALLPRGIGLFFFFFLSIFGKAWWLFTIQTCLSSQEVGRIFVAGVSHGGREGPSYTAPDGVLRFTLTRNIFFIKAHFLGFPLVLFQDSQRKGAWRIKSISNVAIGMPATRCAAKYVASIACRDVSFPDLDCSIKRRHCKLSERRNRNLAGELHQR